MARIIPFPNRKPEAQFPKFRRLGGPSGAGSWDVEAPRGLAVYRGGHTCRARLRQQTLMSGIGAMLLAAVILAMRQDFGVGLVFGLSAAVVWIVAGARPSNWEKGERGEDRVAEVIHQAASALPQLNDGFHLQDIALVVDGERLQIDHLLINRHGVFVLEVKSWSGPQEIAIDGTWLAAGQPRKNPVAQLERQKRLLIKWLHKALPASTAGLQVPIISLVVWAVPLEFRGTRPKQVITIDELVPTIVRLGSGLPPIRREYQQQIALAFMLPDLGLPGGAGTCGA